MTVRAFVEADADVIRSSVATARLSTWRQRSTTGRDFPMLGVPAGVKVYSSVFAVSPERPRARGPLLRAERAEVMDIDEDDFSGGEVVTELRAVAEVPVADQRQSAKQLGGGRSIARRERRQCRSTRL